MSSIVLIGAGVLLLVVGVGVGYWLGTLGRNQAAKKASDLEKELGDYRLDVTEHFRVTAEQFQAIGREYRKLYEHMATGAASLCDAKATGGRPSFPSADMITRGETAAGVIVDETRATPPGDFAPQAAAVPEPSDEELRETEAAEEWLAEHDMDREAEELEKTYH